MLFNGALRPKLLNNPFACCSLISFDFLLLHIAHVDKIIVLPLVVFETLGFILSVFFLHFNNMITLCLYNTDIFTCLLITSYRPKYLRIISSFFLKRLVRKDRCNLLSFYH